MNPFRVFHEPASPCVGICALDADSVCLGCGRRIEEIAAWGTSAASEKQAIVEAAAERLAIIRLKVDVQSI